MSSQKKLIEDILSSYDTINENKRLVFEVVDIYPNINFKDRVVGNSTPSTDNINTTLLQDIQKAAQSAGLMVDVTTAVSGHDKGTRHESGNAVDIAMINNKAVSSSNREDADKLVNALISMGYVKNRESGDNKSVLTFGFKGHDNHVHVGYPGDKIQQPSASTGTTTGETTTTTTQPTTATKGRSSREFVKTVGSSLLNAIGIQESFKPGSFGRNAKLMNGKVIIPRNLNQKIKSPVSGEIVDVLSHTSCMNQIVIEFEDGYLEYCGITTPSDKLKKKVGVGTVLGTTTSNVTVTLYAHNQRKESIVFDSESQENNKEKEEDGETKKDGDLSGKSGYAQLLIKGYRNVKNAFDKTPNEKVEENIKRIKGLL
jgi:hypothetical protein